MAPKSCRHASQALRIADFRRALRHHDALGCELCAAPAVRGNSRSKTGSAAAKRGRRSPQSPEEAAGLDDSHGSSRGGSNEALSPAETLKGWAPNAAWDDLYICVTCGYMGCLGKNHFLLHFQMQPKHYVGFHVGSRTFFCCPCKQEVDATKGKIQDAIKECNDAFDEIAGKQQRRVKNKLVTNPALTPDDDEYPDSSRSYVNDGETKRGLDLNELRAMLEADDDADPIATGQLERPRSITMGTDHSRAPANDQDIDSGAPEPVSAPVVPTPIEQPPVKPVVQPAPTVLGFSNLGNTCYFNAATQALLTALHYFPQFTHDDEVIVRIVDSPVAATLMMLNQTIIQKTRNLPPISPGKESGKADTRKSKASSKNKSPPKPTLTVAPLLKEMRKKFSQFRGNYQQDAHELFTSLLWAIDEEIDPPQLAKTEKADSSRPSDEEQKHQQSELVNVFVKTDSGETISLRVAPDASMDEIQAMLAKKLSLDDSEVFLQPSGGRQTLTRRSTMHSRQSPASYSKVNFVRTLFGGALTTEVRCQACGNCSETVEDAFQLSLPIPSNPDGKYITVKDCLKYFTVETQLRVDSETGYECEKCSRPAKTVGSRPPSPSLPPVLRDASMRMRISELPRVLVLHLKRLGRLRKITQHIQFDAMLDMAPHVDDDVLERHESTMYELIAVVVHKGNKRAGHYVAYVSRKNMSSIAEEASASGTEDDDDPFTKTTRSTLWTLEDPDHDWFYVSDSLVQSVGFDSVLKCEAYMLFYQRVAPATTDNIPRYTEATERPTDMSELRDTAVSYADRDTSCWI